MTSSTKYQVNLTLSAGASFYKEFYLTNPDRSFMDISDCAFYAKLAKHADALNVIESTSTTPLWKYVDFVVSVVSAAKGIYSISLTPEITEKLEEGKYVYTVMMKDGNGTLTPVHNGLVFVDKNIGLIESENIDPNYP